MEAVGVESWEKLPGTPNELDAVAHAEAPLLVSAT
jgi:hypothetical protein